MQQKLRKSRKKGQSLVEFALTVTLLFLFLSAIIDLGLAYFAVQGLNGAVQESVSYASLRPTINSGKDKNDDEIRARLRFESGVNNKNTLYRVHFLDLTDLNNNKVDDKDEGKLAILIKIQTVPSAANSSPSLHPCNDTKPSRLSIYCDIKVTATYTYRPLFSFASLLGLDHIDITRSAQQLIQ